MSDEREEIARIIRDNVSGPQFRDAAMKAAHQQDIYNAADAILARAQGPGEAVALTSALANACYLMSEPHLSGHRVILGFDALDGATAAHVALSMAIIAATRT